MPCLSGFRSCPRLSHCTCYIYSADCCIDVAGRGCPSRSTLLIGLAPHMWAGSSRGWRQACFGLESAGVLPCRVLDLFIRTGRDSDGPVVISPHKHIHATWPFSISEGLAEYRRPDASCRRKEWMNAVLGDVDACREWTGIAAMGP